MSSCKHCFRHQADVNKIFVRLGVNIEIESEKIVRCKSFSMDLINLRNHFNNVLVGFYKVQVLKYSNPLKNSEIDNF